MWQDDYNHMVDEQFNIHSYDPEYDLPWYSEIPDEIYEAYLGDEDGFFEDYYGYEEQ